MGVAVDSRDAVYTISERWAGSVIIKLGVGRVFDDSARSITAGVNGAVTGQMAFSGGSGFSIDKFGSNPTNNFYIADAINHAVKVYSIDGKSIKRWGSEDGFGVTNTGTTNQIFDFPSQSFPLDDGSYLIVDNFTVRHLSSTGDVLKTTRLTQGCFFSGGVTFTPDGTLFCTSGQKVLARFIDGTWTAIGQNSGGRKDGRSDVALFDVPQGLATYQGDVYVADQSNRQIRKITRIAGTKNFEVQYFCNNGVATNGLGVNLSSAGVSEIYTQITIEKIG